MVFEISPSSSSAVVDQAVAKFAEVWGATKVNAASGGSSASGNNFSLLLVTEDHK